MRADAGGDDKGSNGAAGCSDLAEDFVCVTGTVKTKLPDGQKGVSVSVLGQPTTSTKTSDRGEFAVALDAKANPVATSGSKALVRQAPAPGDYTIVMHNAKAKAGRTSQIKVRKETLSKAVSTSSTESLDLGAVELLPTGNVSGVVTLAGETDHTGIHVYIPGTSYAANTAADGKFVISDVPPGLFPFVRAERDGYNFAIVAAVEVPSGDTVALAPLTLSVDTGSKGTFHFLGVVNDAQGAYSTTPELTVAVVATDDAVLMMVSEDNSFEGASWQPVETQLTHVFVGDGQHTLYVKFANANGLETSPVSAKVTIDTDPKVTIVSPASTTTNSRPTVDWSDTRIEDATYALQIARDSSFTDRVVDETGLSHSQYTLGVSLSTAQDYYARVAIQDGQTRSWSQAAHFSVDFGTVTPLAPLGAQPLSRPTLDWSEPLVANAQYHLQISTSASFATTVLDIDDLTSSSYLGATVFAPGQTYYWRVAVIDENGVEASFASANSFSVDLGTVLIDALPVPQKDSTPTLSWAASNLSGATYRVQIATDSAFTDLVDSATGLSATQYTTATLEQGETYYARVAVIDENGAQGSWAGPQSFSVDLGSVSLLAPTTAALSNDTTPSFSWTENDIAASYTLTYSTDAGLANPTVITGIATAEYTLTSALPDTASTTYYWAVTPVDEHGVSGVRSSISSFQLDTVAPTVFFSLNQGDLTTYSEVVVATLRGSDVSEMIVTKIDPDANASWVPYTGQVTLDYSTLANTNTATITAYAFFKDAAGNVSQKVSDSITLKRTVVSTGTLAANTSWTELSSPYYVTGSLIVLDPYTLTLEPGVTVYFKSGAKIETRSGGAGIYAVGTDVAPIKLFGARLDLNYANAWVNAGRPNTYDGSGNYSGGPRFEYVQMNDGTIYVKIVNFDGPGFYMRNSSLAQVSADFFGYVAASYIEHSTVYNMGAAGQDLDLESTKVLNSYVNNMFINGYTLSGMTITDCEIQALSIDRWFPTANTLAFNNIHALTWRRPSTTHYAVLHDNNIVGTGPFLLQVELDTGGSGASLDATGNYWGVAATAEMQASQQNISLITDFYDDSNLVIVDYSDFLTTPVVGAGPDW